MLCCLPHNHISCLIEDGHLPADFFVFPNTDEEMEDEEDETETDEDIQDTARLEEKIPSDDEDNNV
jgi:hypothetical protein